MHRSHQLLVRLAVLGGLLAILFIVYFFYQASGPEQSRWSLFVALFVLLGVLALHRAVLAFATAAVALGSRSQFLKSISLRGFFGTCWEIYRRRLLVTLRLPILMAIWGLLLFGTVWLLSKAAALDGLETRLLGLYSPAPDTTGVPLCRIFTLYTPDNNLVTYFRSVAVVADDLRRLGARAVLVEKPSYLPPDFDTLSAISSLKKSGVLLYAQARSVPENLPLPNPPPTDWRRADLLFEPAPVATENVRILPFRPVPRWYSPAVHVAMRAVAEYRSVRETQQPVYFNGAVRYAGIAVPVTTEGEAYTPREGRREVYIEGSAHVVAGNDTLQYTDPTTYRLSGTLPSAYSAQVANRIIMIFWVNPGGLKGLEQAPEMRQVPALIENIQRGRFIVKAEGWNHLISVLVLALLAGLSVGRHLRVALLAALGIALALAIASIWLFYSQWLLAGLVYSIAATLLGGLVFPAIVYSHRNP